MATLFLGESVVLEYESFRKWGHITEIKATSDGEINKGYIVLSNEDYSYKLYLTRGDSLQCKHVEEYEYENDEYIDMNYYTIENISDNEITLSY